jgi:hypothetical protein
MYSKLPITITLEKYVSESEDNLFSDSNEIIMEIEETRNKKNYRCFYKIFRQS